MTTSSVRGTLATLGLFVALSSQTTAAHAASMMLMGKHSYTYGGIGVPYPIDVADDQNTVSATAVGSSSVSRPMVLIGGVMTVGSRTVQAINAVTEIDSGPVLDLDDDYAGTPVDANVVPIPAAAWLFASALGLLGWRNRSS